ncbi:unnamed protein product [marine sediment metagenome]|uniref:Uncharacterized protein n=1 Tax=marine sediment metagenome TaxID=412755 RepID=X1USX4_9ZZZZ
MAESYTQIFEIEAPDSAARGQRVDVSVRVKNIDPDWDHLISCKANYDGMLFIDEAVIINRGSDYLFVGHFTMPNKASTIDVSTYYPVGPDWILDDEAQVSVALKAAPPVGCLPLVILGLTLIAGIIAAIVTVAS